MRAILQDLRHAARNFLKSRGFTFIAMLTLAVGIGANTAIFSIIDAVLLRPLPYRNPDRLVRLYETEAAPGKYPFTGPDFMDWKTRNATFTDMALYGWPSDVSLAGKGPAATARGIATAANFFSVLGVNPVVGRTFASGEDQPGQSDSAVLGYALWQSRFGGDRHIAGRTLEANAHKYTVVGVMPPGFNFPFGVTAVQNGTDL